MATTRALFAGDDPTPDSVKRRRAIAAELLRKGAETQDIRHPLQAVGAVMQSWAGYMNDMKADREEAEGAALRQKAWNDIADRAYPQGGALPGMVDAAAGGTGSSSSSYSSVAPIVPAGDIETSFLNTVKGGVTNPFGLAAVAATGRAESSYSPENAFGAWSDPSQSGQPGTAGGILSWRAERLSALKAFAQANGDDPARISPETQAKFFLQEDPALVERLNAAGSVEEAQSLMNNAWKFAGYDRPGGEAERRLGLARGYLPGFQGGGQGAQVASLDPSAGMAATAPAASDAFDWSPYATAGATREDSFSGMTPEFRGGLQALVQAAPPELGLQVGSGYRSVQRQQELWDASDKTGRTVARPGRSQHNHGNAADLYAGGVRLDKASPEARAWVHANAGQFGLSFPMDYEPWHVELAGARGGGGGRTTGGAAAPVQVASTDPTAGMALAYARPGIELGTGTVDVPNPLQTPGPRPVQAVAPTPVASQQYDLPPVPTPAPRDGRQALAAELLGGAAGPGDPWQGLREADVLPALGNEEPAAARATQQARSGSPSNQAIAGALLADAGGGQPQVPSSLYDRAMIAELLGNQWTEDIGQQLLSQEIQHRQWYARQQYEARQAVAQAEAARHSGLVDYEARKRIDQQYATPAESFQTLTADEVQQLGLPPGVYQRSTDGGIDKVADAPKLGEVEWQELPNGDYGFFDPATRQFQKLGSAPKGGEGGSITLPDGTRVVTGGAALTEGQSKDTVYATRAQGALATLDQYAPSLASRKDIAMDSVPFGYGREYFQSTDYQLARQAGDEFLQAILRKDTGAAITEQEQVLYGRTYLPEPGDQPERLALKQQARRRALEAIKAGLPPSAIVAQELALQRSGSPPSGAASSQPSSDNDPLGIR